MIENKMAASKFMDKMKQIEFLLCKKQFFALRGLQRAMPDESVRFLQSIEIDAMPIWTSRFESLELAQFGEDYTMRKNEIKFFPR